MHHQRPTYMYDNHANLVIRDRVGAVIERLCKQPPAKVQVGVIMSINGGNRARNRAVKTHKSAIAKTRVSWRFLGLSV